MIDFMRGFVFAIAIVLINVATSFAQAPVDYRLSFPAPEHRWMQVEVTFTEVPPGPLQVRMSRTSPGRYALHEFAKNVFDVKMRDGKGKPLTPRAPTCTSGTWPVTTAPSSSPIACSAIASTAPISASMRRTRT